MDATRRFLSEHEFLSRRFFLSLGAAGAVLAQIPGTATAFEPRNAVLESAVTKLESFLTAPDKFRDVSRGTPLPHKLSDEKKSEVGLTRETWRLEVVSDAEHPAKLGQQFQKSDGTALDFAGLMKLAETHSVKFPKVMTCLNIGCPLGMGIWEGVPLREIFWRTGARENVRRVYYEGFHNDDPKQLFRSSLPIGRVLEDPYDLPPVILCYKVNGEWLSSERGGPVRIVVPEAYGFKSIKWLSKITLTNLAHSNDTYADGNNDIDSPLKSFAATLSVPNIVTPGEPIPVTGYAQVGISGVSKVQIWLAPASTEKSKDDPYFQQAPWSDAEVLPPPSNWGGNLPDGQIPPGTLGFDPVSGKPRSWPMRLAKVHWAALIPGVPAGDYKLRCRTIDEKGAGQPLPRPFRKSGHAAIEEVSITVK
ncbi:MAG: reductase [Planctomycetaceae bacterium]|nr:reductase [Planctomycetaceae bacterium]